MRQSAGIYEFPYSFVTKPFTPILLVIDIQSGKQDPTLSDEKENFITYVHDFWCSPKNPHATGNENDVKRPGI